MRTNPRFWIVDFSFGKTKTALGALLQLFSSWAKKKAIHELVCSGILPVASQQITDWKLQNVFPVVRSTAGDVIASGLAIWQSNKWKTKQVALRFISFFGFTGNKAMSHRKFDKQVFCAASGRTNQSQSELRCVQNLWKLAFPVSNCPEELGRGWSQGSELW